MNKKNFKVGDIIKAIDNNYTITCKNNRWIGIITKVNNKTIKAKTLYCKYLKSCIDEEFKNLKPSEFDIVYRNSEEDDSLFYPAYSILNGIFG